MKLESRAFCESGNIQRSVFMRTNTLRFPAVGASLISFVQCGCPAVVHLSGETDKHWTSLIRLSQLGLNSWDLSLMMVSVLARQRQLTLKSSRCLDCVSKNGCCVQYVPSFTLGFYWASYYVCTTLTNNGNVFICFGRLFTWRRILGAWKHKHRFQSACFGPYIIRFIFSPNPFYIRFHFFHSILMVKFNF